MSNAIVSKEFLSGSTNGRGIKVAATSTPGTTLHTAPAGETTKDEVYLYAQNNHSAAVLLTIEYGGTTSPDDLIKKTIPAADGLWLVIPAIVINNGLAIKAFAGAANVVVIFGHVNRITNPA